METHGTKKELQKRLSVQLAIELEEKKRVAEEKARRRWSSRRLLRGVSSTLGIEVEHVKSEKVTTAWDEFVMKRNGVGAISSYISDYVVDIMVQKLNNAPLRQTTYDHVEDVYENLATSFEEMSWSVENAMKTRRASVVLHYSFNAKYTHTNMINEGAGTELAVVSEKEKLPQSKILSNSTHVLQHRVVYSDGASNDKLSDSQLEENDRDSEMHETFEHLFLEEYIASEGERKHIELMQSQLTKQEDASMEFTWDLQNAKKKHEDSTNSTSLDLFERDESAAKITEIQDNDLDIPERFSGVYIPVNSGQRVQRLQLSLGSWQSAVLNLLGQGNPTAERRIERIFTPDNGAVIFYRYGITQNVRASILGQTDVVGDALWMKKGEKGRLCGEALVSADAKAANRLKDLKFESLLSKENSIKHNEKRVKIEGEKKSNDDKLNSQPEVPEMLDNSPVNP